MRECRYTPNRTHVFQRFHALCIGTHFCLISAALYFSSDFSTVNSDRKVTRHSGSTVPLKTPGCAFHIVQRCKHAFISLTSDSHTHTAHLSPEKMSNSVVQPMARHVERQDISAQVHHSNLSGQCGSIARIARSTVAITVDWLGMVLGVCEDHWPV